MLSYSLVSKKFHNKFKIQSIFLNLFFIFSVTITTVLLSNEGKMRYRLISIGLSFLISNIVTWKFVTV